MSELIVFALTAGLYHLVLLPIREAALRHRVSVLRRELAWERVKLKAAEAALGQMTTALGRSYIATAEMAMERSRTDGLLAAGCGAEREELMADRETRPRPIARLHRLKTWPSFWLAVRDGSKTFEVRRHDRDFAIGDWLVLMCWDPHRGAYVDPDFDQARSGGNPNVSARDPACLLYCCVSYVMPGGRFGIAPDYCVIGFSEVKPVKRAVAEGGADG